MPKLKTPKRKTAIFLPITEVFGSRKNWPVKNLSALFLAFFFYVETSAQQDSLQNIRPFSILQVTAFAARVVSKSVQLQWKVSSNEDAKSFEIERADDGVTFRQVGSKLPAGRGGNVAYEFVDALPKKNTGLDYRIKIISKDGAAVYSSVESKRIEETLLQCRLRQNPVRNAIELEVSLPEAGSLQTSVYTAYGQKIRSETTKLSAGTHLVTVSSHNLLPGLHRLVLESGGERTLLSFVKE